MTGFLCKEGWERGGLTEAMLMLSYVVLGHWQGIVPVQ